MRNIYPVFQPPASQFLHRVYYDLWRFLSFNWKKKNPTLPVHHIYVLLDLQYMIAADIILSWVMIKTDYAEKNNDTDQPTHLHSLF